ncbi:MAG: adenylate/guanylate cyclase domain-containing protein [Pseudomonadota bacterium]|nr:adenylate/guanylate cyclase domain-containing protein [Pseudomonadota bacterium]
MNEHMTMVFIDLTGSTAAYEALGNAQVADVVAKVTQWIGRVCEAHGGQTVKFLGDGVLTMFTRSAQAVEATVFLQQNHTERLQKWPEPLRMALKIGMAGGTVIHRDDDVYGDAVNLASRLADMAGPHGIWVDETVMAELRQEHDTAPTAGEAGSRSVMDVARYRSLGMIRVRGLTEPRSVFQIEWNEDVSTDLMTVRGMLPELTQPSPREGTGIALAWFGTTKTFAMQELPVLIGRTPDSGFVVKDQRVSRSHARIEYANGALVLTDLSSFGTWVRFSENSQTEVQLRRNQCILHSTGEIALGAPFEDFSAPVVAFHVGSLSVSG